MISVAASFFRAALPYILVVVLIVIVCAGIYHEGRKAERAEWEPKFAALEQRARDAENEAKVKEELSRRLRAESDERYANTVFRLNERAVDYTNSIKSLSVRIASLAARSPDVPSDPGSAVSVAPATEVEERALRAGDRIARVGKGCEADAAQVEELQRRYRDLQLLWSTAPAALP
jgi:hypothetical protein